MGSGVMVDRICAVAEEDVPGKRRTKKGWRKDSKRGSGEKKERGCGAEGLGCGEENPHVSPNQEEMGQPAKRGRRGKDPQKEKEEKKLELRFPPKRTGEIWELAFMQKAIRMGFKVSKTWGDSDRYDAVTDWKGRLLRVQVRGTEYRMGARGYAVHASVYVGKKIVGLTKKDIDVLAAYIFPKDLWYVVPVEKFVPRKNLWFYPDGSIKGSKFEEFREAWEWLKRRR